MKTKILKLMVFSFIIRCLLCEFARIKACVYLAVKLWSGTIIPSVFPYIIITKYICNSDILDRLVLLPGKFVSKIFKLSDCSIKPFVCSLFCGYPSGAICTSELYKSGKINKDEASRLVCFTNNAGPLFVISAIGGSMLNNVHKGYAIYIIQIISAILYGYACAVGVKRPISKSNVKTYNSMDFCDVIKDSVNATVNICGFMITAFVLSECTVIFADMIMPDQIKTRLINTIIAGIYEISAGVSAITNSGTGNFEFALVCSFVSWSGFSVIMQIKSIAAEFINTKALIIAKLCQGFISFGLGYGYGIITSDKGAKYNNIYGIKISLLCSIVLFICFFIKKKKLSE